MDGLIIFYNTKMIYIKNKNTSKIQSLNTTWEKLSKGARLVNDLLDENNSQDLLLINSYLLQGKKQSKLRSLEQNRKNKQYQNITLNNIEYKAGKISSDNLTGTIAVMERAALDQITWLDAQDSRVTLTLQEAKNLSIAIFNQYSAAYLKEADLITLINNASTLEEIEQINIEF